MHILFPTTPAPLLRVSLGEETGFLIERGTVLWLSCSLEMVIKRGDGYPVRKMQAFFIQDNRPLGATLWVAGLQ